MKRHYGIPYKGSKEKILYLLQYVFDRESDKKYLIDPFCGGFSVCAYALENTKFRVLANDLNEYVIELCREILFNKAEEIKKVWFDWVSREGFSDVKNNPANYPKWYVGYVTTIWSFGNNQKCYLFGKDIEEIKKQAHLYLIENGYRDNQHLRLKLLKQFKQKSLINGRFELQQLERLQQLQQLERLEQLEQLERLQQLERLERLQQLQQLERLEQLEQLERLERLQQLERLERLQQLERLEQLDSMDWYDFIESIPESILNDSFIYCDPPYENTSKYSHNDMDYNKFWDWFRNCQYPVYVSSYSAPDDIKPIRTELKRVLLSPQKRSNPAREHIYFNGRGEQSNTMFDLLGLK